MPNATRAYTPPITANCTRCGGRHSTLAPTSSRIAGTRGLGIDAAQHAERGVGGHHGGARVTGAEDGRRVTTRDESGRHSDRCYGFSPQRRRRRLVHRHHIRRVDDADAGAIEVAVPLELRVDFAGAADERDAEIELARGGERAVDHQARREVAAHRVDSYPNHRQG